MIRRGHSTERADALTARPFPEPTPQFRRRAWRAFQRALDPLAPPKRLKQLPQR